MIFVFDNKLDLLQKCWLQEPTDRPSMKKVCDQLSSMAYE